MPQCTWKYQNSLNAYKDDTVQTDRKATEQSPNYAVSISPRAERLSFEKSIVRITAIRASMVAEAI